MYQVLSLDDILTYEKQCYWDEVDRWIIQHKILWAMNIPQPILVQTCDIIQDCMMREIVNGQIHINIHRHKGIVDRPCPNILHCTYQKKKTYYIVNFTVPHKWFQTSIEKVNAIGKVYMALRRCTQERMKSHLAYENWDNFVCSDRNSS